MVYAEVIRDRCKLFDSMPNPPEAHIICESVSVFTHNRDAQ